MAVTSQIGIVDRTTYDGLTAAAIAMWRAMAIGAERAGLSRIVMTAGAGGGHLSHSHGTEIDLVAYNADGSLWTAEQRVAVAAAAAEAGGNRFGFYSRSGAPVSSLHVGLGYPGAPRNVAWGPNGQTSGVSVNGFHPEERGFVEALRSGQIRGYLPTVWANVGSSGNGISVEVNPFEGNPFGVSGRSRVDVRLTSAADFKIEEADSGKAADAEANRRSMIDAVAPAIRQVVERGGLLRKGVTGDAVRQLQAFLNAAGFTDANGDVLDEDGEFGRRTREAVEAYQAARGVTADGIVGPNTFGRMTADITGVDSGPATVAPPAYTPSPPMQTALAAANADAGLGRRAEGDAVSELQRWLNFHGYTDAAGNALDVDGSFGPLTEQALMAAQRAAGVPVTGRLDPATAAAFQALDTHELAVTQPDVNAAAPVDDALPPAAAAPVPDRSYEAVYDQPDLSSAQARQYAAEKGMVTEPAPVPLPLGNPERAPAGRVAPGNIDLANRPRVRNADGSISTVRSITVEFDGRFYLLPTVSPDGRVLSSDDAIQLFRETGQHLGIFDTEGHADGYAQTLHNQQAAMISVPQAGITPPGWQAIGASGEPADTTETDIYASPALTDAQAAQYQAERSMVTPAGQAVAAPQMVRSSSTTPAVLSWRIPVTAAPVGPLASPYPVRLPATAAASPVDLWAGPQGSAYRRVYVPGSAAMDAREAAMARRGATQTEAARSAADEEAAARAFGLRFDGMTLDQLGQVDTTALTWEQRQAYDAASIAAMDAESARIAGRLGGTAAAAPAARTAPPAAAAGAATETPNPYAAMSREDLMAVDVTTLSREQWQQWDAAMTRAAEAMKAGSDLWLRDTLKRNGAPAERVAGSSQADLVAISTQPNKRFVPTGTATATVRPPKNTPLAKTQLLVRKPTAPASASV